MIDDDARTEAYPLCWPAGWPRTPHVHRKHGKFIRKTPGQSWGGRKLTIAEAMRRVHVELDRLGAHHIVVSTNLRVRRSDGGPMADQREPDDPGAAAYWNTADDQRRCIAIDIYAKVVDNIAALAATLDAFRAVERHGGSRVIERAFTGLRALPNLTRHWRAVLDADKFEKQGEVIDRDWIQRQYRAMAHDRHPDKGGSDGAMAELNRAREDALREVRE